MKRRKVKKVFHIISHFDLGGAERVAVNIAKSDNEDFEYHIVEVIRGGTPFTKVFIRELEAAGIRYHRAFIPEVHFHYLFERLAAMLFPLWFVFLFLRHRPDIIHSHTEVPDMGVRLFFRLFPRLTRRCKVVRTIHNTRLWTGMKGTGRRVERFFLKHNANVSISAAVSESYEKEYGDPGRIIYNGVSRVMQKPYEDIVKGKTNILFAGRLEPQKGVRVLIETVKRLADDGRFHFHIIGDGSLQESIEREIGSLECVSLRSTVYGLQAYLSSFDFMFMPSEFEGLSMMSIEASMEGLPVVASDRPGLRDTLPGDWCLKSKNNTAEEYAGIFRDPELAHRKEQLGAIACAFAERNFGIKRMQERYEAFYSE